MMKRKTVLALSVALLANIGLMSTAHAQDEGDSQLGGYIILGGGMKPEYEGSEDLEATPYAAGKLQYGRYYLEAKGSDLRANVSSFAGIEFGPVVNFGGGRDDDIKNKAVARMREIDDTVEAGAFIKLPIKQVFDRTDELAFEVEYLADTGDSHEGYKIGFGPSYRFSPTERLRLGASIKATYANEDYNQTYFGVDADNAIRSGLAQYRADSGIKDIGVGFSAMYSLDKNWSLVGVAQYKQLVGDAADSPVVDKEGSAGQVSVGFGVSYRF